jgi:hypothetical protein
MADVHGKLPSSAIYQCYRRKVEYVPIKLPSVKSIDNDAIVVSYMVRCVVDRFKMSIPINCVISEAPIM